MTRYYYGGTVRDRVFKMGVSERIPITTSIPDAVLVALEAKGYVYEIRPVGKVKPDPDGEPGVSFLTKKFKIVERIPWKTIRHYLQFELSHEQQAQDSQEPVRQEGALP